MLADAGRGFWNGFNDHANVSECNNRSSEGRLVSISIFNNGGSLIASPTQVIPSLGTRHFLLDAQQVDDPISVSVSNLPAGASYDNSTKTISWTPGGGDLGVHIATITVTAGD